MDESGKICNMHDGVPDSLKEGAIEREIAQDLADIKAMDEENRHLDKENTYNQCRIFYERGQIKQLEAQIQNTRSKKEELIKFISELEKSTSTSRL